MVGVAPKRLAALRGQPRNVSLSADYSAAGQRPTQRRVTEDMPLDEDESAKQQRVGCRVDSASDLPAAITSDEPCLTVETS